MVQITDTGKLTWPCCGKAITEVQKTKIAEIAILLASLENPILTIDCMVPTCSHRIVMKPEENFLSLSHGEESIQISL